MYRDALAAAAKARGWAVHWYDRNQVVDQAKAVVGRATGGAGLSALLTTMGRALGPPWQAQHKLAATAALAAFGAGRPSRRKR
ncbi:MAG TPA: hypothetical protein VGF45_21050 [Polyangia bacterium]